MRSPKLTQRQLLNRLRQYEKMVGPTGFDFEAEARRIDAQEEAAARLRDTCDRCLLQEAAARRLVSFNVVPFVDRSRRYRSGPSVPFRP
jgi:hypothetical protein